MSDARCSGTLFLITANTGLQISVFKMPNFSAMKDIEKCLEIGASRYRISVSDIHIACFKTLVLG